ncbi:MAG: glycosyltransferase family 1 protein [Marivirga sp.]|nr:glycosyltransferase family 1 protein [Marivirga sp.]
MKVLMLGWEFPPMFTGGLGIATYGMVKSLRHDADIRLIIPSNSGGSVDLPNVKIIGLNKVSASELAAGQFSYEDLTSEVHRLPLTLSPYEHVNKEIIKNKLDQYDVSSEDVKTIDIIHDLFSGRDIYGANILKKIALYTQLAEQIASDKDYDVIHAHDWITFAAGVRIKKMSGKPLVLHVHSLETDRAGESCRNGIYMLEKDSMMDADRIFAVSQYTKDQIIQHYAIAANKISVVHNGIDPGDMLRKPHQLRDKLVVFLGRITHQKGPEFLLETVEKVAQVYPRVKFVVAGTGDQFAHLLETSAYKKIGSKFIFAGFLSKSEVDELLSMADVYFMPSVSEPFGITALEAAQHRVPSVLSVQSGAAEVLKASLKADFWDTDKYANYIYALLKYNALNNELSEHAKAELNHITWDHAAKKILDGYQQLIRSQNN